MPVPIIRAHGDDGGLGTDGGDQRRRVCGVRAVVRRNVDARREGRRRQEEVGDRVVDRVSHEEDRGRAVAHAQHQARDIDAAVASRREDLDRDATQPDHRALGDGPARHVRACKVL